MNAFQ
jgi:hypothetical protein